MKQLYLKCLLLGILSFIDVRAYAYDCYVNGIYYNLNEDEKKASVTYLDISSSNSSAYQGTVTIPSKIAYNETEYIVTSVGVNAFYNCRGLVSINLPNSVTTIGCGAFQNCSGLTSASIGNNVTIIDGYAFFGCRKLKSFTFGNSVNIIGDYAFYGCSGLTLIDIPNSVNTIGDYAFGGCSGLTSVTIGNSVTTIGYSAFNGCSKLTSIDIPNSVTNIKGSAFQDCIMLSSVIIGNSVSSIRELTFFGCSGLTSITIGKSVTSIEVNAFRDCHGLTSIFIVDGSEPLSLSANSIIKLFGDCPIESLYLGRNISYSDSDSPFMGKTTLTSLTIGNSVSNIGGSAFSGCTGLTSVNIPDRVTSIGDNAFYGCTGLKSIEIPNRVTSIGNNAFQNCSDLTSLSIPISVTSIGNGAFYGCTNLESVYSEITDVFSIDAFGEGCDAVLYVPYGKKLTYIQTPGWNVFNDIIEMDPALMNTSLLLSCNSKGSITINGTTVFTNKIGSVDILEDAENTIVFTPKANCKLEQVCFNGFDVTTSVENNTLKAVIPAKSQMVVTFAKESGDMNNDGIINISDVVVLVNMILGQ